MYHQFETVSSTFGLVLGATTQQAARVGQVASQYALDFSKKMISQKIFAVGESAQYVSENIGYALVDLGYLLIDEPTKIYDVKVATISPTEAIISWQTNHPANGKVNYGFDPSYGMDVQTPVLSTYHKFTLTNLQPATTYHFEVMSHAKTYVYDANRQFTTANSN